MRILIRRVDVGETFAFNHNCDQIISAVTQSNGRVIVMIACSGGDHA